MTRVTIEQVAARSGVSVATVSRAMRGLPNVSPTTRDRVMAIIAEMDYEPDPNAVRLAAGRSGMVALAVSALPLWYTSQILAGVEAVLADDGRDLLVVTLGDGTASALVGGLRRRVDGIIILDIEPTEFEAASLRAMGVPWVLVGGRTDQAPCLWIDNREGARQIVSHLILLGHRRIGLIASAANRLNSKTPELRIAGYRQALGDAGIAEVEDLVVDGNFSRVGGEEAMATLLDLEVRPTAVFALSDDMAFGAMAEAKRRGLSVPDDVAIAGFDDHDMAGSMGLTTIHQDPQDMGAMAARLVIELIAGSIPAVGNLEYPLRVIVRESTATTLRTGR